MSLAMADRFNEFMSQVGTTTGKGLKKVQDALQKDVNGTGGGDKSFPWGLVVLLIGAAYALFELVRVVIYFFG